MKKRSHRNDRRRLTARERATAFCEKYEPHERNIGALLELLGAHARQTLARHKRKAVRK